MSDMKLEIVIIPVSDVDRAKRFYAGLGWRLDIDYTARDDDYRVVQFTPPGSECSVMFGRNMTTAAPGSLQGLHLIVSDIEATRDALRHRGVEISQPLPRPGRRVPPYRCARPGRRFESAAQELRLLRLVQRSGRQRLGGPGGHRAIVRRRRTGRSEVHERGLGRDRPFDGWLSSLRPDRRAGDDGKARPSCQPGSCRRGPYSAGPHRHRGNKNA